MNIWLLPLAILLTTWLSLASWYFYQEWRFSHKSLNIPLRVRFWRAVTYCPVEWVSAIDLARRVALERIWIKLPIPAEIAKEAVDRPNATFVEAMGWFNWYGDLRRIDCVLVDDGEEYIISSRKFIGRSRYSFHISRLDCMWKSGTAGVVNP